MSLDSFFVRIMITLMGSAAAFVGIAGGYYTVYRLVTLIGA
jgi:hypothetical protein